MIKKIKGFIMKIVNMFKFTEEHDEYFEHYDEFHHGFNGGW